MRVVVFSLLVFTLAWCVARWGRELRKVIVNPDEEAAVSVHDRSRGKKIVQPAPSWERYVYSDERGTMR
jgi:hypothetical protein